MKSPLNCGITSVPNAETEENAASKTLTHDGRYAILDGHRASGCGSAW